MKVSASCEGLFVSKATSQTAFGGQLPYEGSR